MKKTKIPLDNPEIAHDVDLSAGDTFPRPIVRNTLNAPFTRRDSDYETPVGKSSTVPDQTLSTRAILDRYTKTGQIIGGKQPVYDLTDSDMENLPEFAGINLETLDIEQRHQLLTEARNRVSTLTKKLNHERNVVENEKRKQQWLKEQELKKSETTDPKKTGDEKPPIS